MKYLILVPDGMADEPIEELGGKTPLEVAHTTNLDYMAQNGFTGLVQTIPDGMPPGSDIGNLALLGYDPKIDFTGRAPLEAASMGIELGLDEVAFRCNLVTIADETMFDYSAGHISTEEAAKLIHELNEKIGRPEVKFYPGKGYRHLMVIKTPLVEKFLNIKCTPPHDISGKKITSFLPQGPSHEVLLSIMEQSKTILAVHEINRVRLDLKENPATMIWLWGQGKRPNLPLFKDRWNLTGSIISAVDLVNGIGRLAGLDVINVPGATGYYDTNYEGKAYYAIESLKKKDFVYVHVEAPDEAGHNGDLKAKINCIERFDRELVGTVLNHFGKHDQVRILVSPDHPTPIAKKTHTRAPVCFVMFGAGIATNNMDSYNEITAQKIGLKFSSGMDMIQYFFKH